MSPTGTLLNSSPPQRRQRFLFIGPTEADFPQYGHFTVFRGRNARHFGHTFWRSAAAMPRHSNREPTFGKASFIVCFRKPQDSENTEKSRCFTPLYPPCTTVSKVPHGPAHFSDLGFEFLSDLRISRFGFGRRHYRPLPPLSTCSPLASGLFPICTTVGA
jgi:hypothetical protein